MRSRELDGWDEFKSLISQVVKGDREWGVIGDYWFRGQGDSTYKLESSLDRTHRDLKVSVTAQRVKIAECSEAAIAQNRRKIGARFKLG